MERNETQARPFRVCLLGASLDNPNRGVCALAQSFFQLVLAHRPDAELNSLYGRRTAGTTSIVADGREVPVRIVNCRHNPRAALSQNIYWILLMALAYRLGPAGLRRRICRGIPWIAALDEADFIGEIRGGDSFSDLYGLRKFILGALPTLTPILMGKPLVLLPQTFIAFRSAIALSLAEFILRRAHRVYARDERSLGVARQTVGPRRVDRVDFCPDVAFFLEPAEPPADILTEPLPSDGRAIVGININGMLYAQSATGSSFGIQSNYRQFIEYLVERILETTEADVLLVPHVFSTQAQDDLAPSWGILKGVAEEERHRIHLVKHPTGPAELKSIIGQCSLFIGSRMHSCIAALSQGIPCLGVAYSDKFIGVFNTVGAGDGVLEAWNLSSIELADAVLAQLPLAGKDAGLQARVQQAREHLVETAGSMLNDSPGRRTALDRTTAAHRA